MVKFGYSWMVNNYQLGAKVKSTPKHNIVINKRIDNRVSQLVYVGISSNEVEFIEKLFNKPCKVVAILPNGEIK